jgi:hypothetical protein
MSIGTAHAHLNRATPARLEVLQHTPSFRRMWARPFKVDTNHQVPDTAGYNVAGNVYYIDKDFFAVVTSGQLRIEKMPPKAIIAAILIHERTEKCLLDADNDVVTLLGVDRVDYDGPHGAHEYATLAEHQFVRRFTTPRAYEAGLAQIIRFNEHKPITNPPKDLDCEPYLDEMEAADRRALTEMRRAGVDDADKVTKESVKYSRAKGEDRCVRCKNWMGSTTAELAPCKGVAGAVRTEFWCTRYELRTAQQKPQPQPEQEVNNVPRLEPPVPQQAAPQGQEALHPHIAALVEGTKATQDLVRELAKQRQGTQAQDMGQADGTGAASVPPGTAAPPARKAKRHRKISMTRDADGNLVAEVHEAGKPKKSIKATKDDSGNLQAEVHEAGKPRRQIKTSRDSEGNLQADVTEE